MNCFECGATTIWYNDREGGRALCRPCWSAITDGRRQPKMTVVELEGRVIEYVRASILYYHLDQETGLADAMFDGLCALLLKYIDVAKQTSLGHLIDEDALRAGTGYHIGLDAFPFDRLVRVPRHRRRPVEPKVGETVRLGYYKVNRTVSHFVIQSELGHPLGAWTTWDGLLARIGAWRVGRSTT